MHLHGLLQCANDYINMSVVPALCPAEQAKTSSTQLYKDHLTNGAQRKETGMKTKQSLGLQKSLIQSVLGEVPIKRLCGKRGILFLELQMLAAT